MAIRGVVKKTAVWIERLITFIQKTQALPNHPVVDTATKLCRRDSEEGV
jgi:hypothetical protein